MNHYAAPSSNFPMNHYRVVTPYLNTERIEFRNSSLVAAPVSQCDSYVLKSHDYFFT